MAEIFCLEVLRSVKYQFQTLYIVTNMTQKRGLEEYFINVPHLVYGKPCKEVNHLKYSGYSKYLIL